jgi:hypothetical protein
MSRRQRGVCEGQAPREHERNALEHIYAKLPSSDLSADLLQFAVADSLVLPMHGVKWTDWGDPDRIVESLESIGERPHFPIRHPEGSASRARAADLVA